MSITMKALKSFGIDGSNEGPVRRGREFQAAHEKRARDLENEGLAFRIKTDPAPVQNKMEPPAPANKASDTGPFDSAGGQTGEARPQLSLPRGRQPRRPTSGTSGED